MRWAWRDFMAEEYGSLRSEPGRFRAAIWQSKTSIDHHPGGLDTLLGDRTLTETVRIVELPLMTRLERAVTLLRGRWGFTMFEVADLFALPEGRVFEIIRTIQNKMKN
jgi:hypothetical protein